MEQNQNRIPEKPSRPYVYGNCVIIALYKDEKSQTFVL